MQDPSSPFVVGLTGGIAAGKSTVAQMLKSLGGHVWNADEVAKSSYRTHPELRQQIVERLGRDVGVTNDHGQIVDIDRKALSQIVFGDEEALRWLETLVHPIVGQAFDQWLNTWTERSPRVWVVREAAILFESESHVGCDFIVTVEAPEDVRIQRAISRSRKRGQVDLQISQVKERMKRQWTRDQRIARANMVIENDGATPLLPQVLELHRHIDACMKGQLH